MSKNAPLMISYIKTEDGYRHDLFEIIDPNREGDNEANPLIVALVYEGEQVAKRFVEACNAHEDNVARIKELEDGYKESAQIARKWIARAQRLEKALDEIAGMAPSSDRATIIAKASLAIIDFPYEVQS